MNRKGKSSRPWTDQEVFILKKHYNLKGAKFVWKLLATLGYKRTYLAVKQNARKLGYYLTGPNSGCIKKGHIPWNKGKTLVMPLNAGNFPKGHIPASHCPVGSIRKRTRKNRINQDYTWIKVAEPNKWELLHRHLWAKHNGPIPHNRIVAFIDGDHDNICIENIELISRIENAMRNQNRDKAKITMGSADLTDKYVCVLLARGSGHNYTYYMEQKDLIRFKRQQLILNRQIKANA